LYIYSIQRTRSTTYSARYSAASNNRPKEVAQDYRLKIISKRESLASSNLRKVE
jgi:hypothetical protein